jgi:hypothetical protein
MQVRSLVGAAGKPPLPRAGVSDDVLSGRRPVPVEVAVARQWRTRVVPRANPSSLTGRGVFCWALERRHLAGRQWAMLPAHPGQEGQTG